MPPAPHRYHGPAAIAGFLQASVATRAGHRLRLLPTRANTQPAFRCYSLAPQSPAGGRAGLIVLSLAGERIDGITRFLDAALLARFETRLRR